MPLAQRLLLKQSQQLVMTPQLQLAIRMLQMNSVEVAAVVAEEVERNPLLSLEAPGTERATRQADPPPPREENVGAVEAPFDTGRDNLYEAADAPPPPRKSIAADSDLSDIGERAAPAPSLREHLLGQIALAPGGVEARRLASLLVDELDEAGYLRPSVDELAARHGAAPDLVEAAIDLVQGCEPTGVGAATLAECLALQLAERDRLDPAMAALLQRLEDLAAYRLESLRAACGVDADDLAEMIAEIRALDPRPGAEFETGATPPIAPDVFVRRDNLGGWAVELNTDALPRVLMDRTYAARVGGDAREPEFMIECRRSAAWLTRALEQRAETILKVSSEIVRQQHMFLEQGAAGLRPMTLRMVADAVNLHESTVSRVTSNKHMATERGVFELKFFFTQGLEAQDGGDSHSAEAVRCRIKSMIDKEKPQKTLSDDQIAKVLKADGVNIARRTVAKYREAMNIPSSVMRRRRKMAAMT